MLRCRVYSLIALLFAKRRRLQGTKGECKPTARGRVLGREYRTGNYTVLFDQS